jgi:hypothetical protein
MKSNSLILYLILHILADMMQGGLVRGADVSHELGKVKPEQLEEISGLAASRLNPDVLWLHNDGDSGQLFAVSTSGKLAAFLKCRTAIKDLEEIAIGPGPAQGVDYLYLGDIGDNDEKRREIRVARFVEPNLQGRRGLQLAVTDAEEIRLSYPNGSHDAEAMFVDPVSGDMFIVTKERDQARLYTVGGAELKVGSVLGLRAAGKLDVEEVSAGAISRDGRQILLRRERQGWLWDRATGETVAEAMEREPKKVPVLGKRQGPNGESIGFTAEGDGYYTVSEGKKQAIYRFDLPSGDGDSDR